MCNSICNKWLYFHWWVTQTDTSFTFWEKARMTWKWWKEDSCGQKRFYCYFLWDNIPPTQTGRASAARPRGEMRLLTLEVRGDLLRGTAGPWTAVAPCTQHRGSLGVLLGLQRLGWKRSNRHGLTTAAWKKWLTFDRKHNLSPKLVSLLFLLLYVSCKCCNFITIVQIL